MQRNAKAVPRARVAAETVAQTIDAFVSAISWRTMVRLLSSSRTLRLTARQLFLLLSAGLAVSLTNATMSGARHRLQRDTAREIDMMERHQRQLEQTRYLNERPPLQHTTTAPAALPAVSAPAGRGWFGRQ